MARSKAKPYAKDHSRNLSANNALETRVQALEQLVNAQVTIIKEQAGQIGSLQLRPTQHLPEQFPETDNAGSGTKNITTMPLSLSPTIDASADPTTNSVNNPDNNSAKVGSSSSSRRSWVKRMAFSAAGLAGVSGAALASQTAQAASGDTILQGNSNIAANSTYLSQTGGTTNLDKGAVLVAEYNASTSALPSQLTGLNVAMAGVSTDSTNSGIGGYFAGNRAPLYLQPMATPTDTHSIGEIYLDNSGNLFLYQSSGWVQANGGGTATSSGTSFPANPTTGQRFFRTDRGIEYYWDALNNAWLSVQTMSLTLSGRDAGLLAQAVHYCEAPVPFANSNGWLFISLHREYVGGTHNAANYYTGQLATLAGPVGIGNNLILPAPISTASANSSGNFTLNDYYATPAAGSLTRYDTFSTIPTGATLGFKVASNQNAAQLGEFPVGNPGTHYLTVSISYKFLG